jgi:hypothetical protein
VRLKLPRQSGEDSQLTLSLPSPPALTLNNRSNSRSYRWNGRREPVSISVPAGGPARGFELRGSSGLGYGLQWTTDGVSASQKSCASEGSADGEVQ